MHSCITRTHLAMVTALAGLFSGVLLAADSDTGDQPSEELEQVVVTGSHIKRAEAETAENVQVI